MEWGSFSILNEWSWKLASLSHRWTSIWKFIPFQFNNSSSIIAIVVSHMHTHTEWRQAAHAILFYYFKFHFSQVSHIIQLEVGKSGLTRSVIVSKTSIKDKRNQEWKIFCFQLTCCFLFTKHAHSGTALSASASIPQDKKLDQVVVCQFGFNFHWVQHN